MPISVMLLGGLYCAWNGFNQSAYLIGVHGYEDSWLVDPRFIIGIALFFSGMIINIQSDNTLFVLKKASTNANGTKRYGIPKGGMFEYVSAANYCKCWIYNIIQSMSFISSDFLELVFDCILSMHQVGEILEWCGFALACWSLPGAAFAWWTIANLVPRAIQVRIFIWIISDDYTTARIYWCVVARLDTLFWNMLDLWPLVLFVCRSITNGTSPNLKIILLTAKQSFPFWYSCCQ